MLRAYGPLIALMSAASGCGLVVDADAFRDAPGEAGDLSLSPPRLEEGSGAPPEGRGVPVLLRGGPFSDDAEIESDDPAVEVSAPRVSEDGRALAAILWSRPMPELGPGETATVTLTVRDGDRVEALPIYVDGLAELELAGDVDSEGVRGRYSDVRTTGPVNVVGRVSLRIESTGRIEVRHRLSVSARGAEPGAGGLRPASGARAGRSGDDVASGCANGGGGAGGAEPGQASPGGAAGGDPLPEGLPTYTEDAGHGGGDGGASGANPGGSGGAGAGGIALLGAVLDLAADLEARGGDGAPAENGNCGANASGSAGGGGAGGHVWLRADDTLRASGAVDVSGGRGGEGGQKAGGDGGDGWLRVDAPDLGGFASAAGLRRGPAWVVEDPIVAPDARLGFVAEPEAALRVWVDGAPAAARADASGRGTIAAPDAPGAYRLCVAPATGRQEESSCLRVAVLP